MQAETYTLGFYCQEKHFSGFKEGLCENQILLVIKAEDQVKGEKINKVLDMQSDLFLDRVMAIKWNTYMQRAR